jgi:hypothetical protein
LASARPRYTSNTFNQGAFEMKSVILSLAAAAALVAAAAPASAQSREYLAEREARLEQRIDRGVARGDLTRQEARSLRGELRELDRLEDRYRRDGLNAWERRDLDARFDRLSARIRFERHDRDNRRW